MSAVGRNAKTAASPLLFGKRKAVAAEAVAQYAGTETELDVKAAQGR